MKPVIPPAPKASDLAEIAAIRAELDSGKVQGSNAKKRYARSEWLWNRLFELSPPDRWSIGPPHEATSPRGERIYLVRTNPVKLPNDGLTHQHIYSTVMNFGGGDRFHFDFEGKGYELRGLDWRTGVALRRHFIPYEWGKDLTTETAGNKLPVMPKTEKAPTRKLRVRKAYINYRLELADSSQKEVAVLAKTTPATVSRVIAGIRKEGVVTERVWSALRDCAKTPIKDLQDPPEMPEDILPRAR